jgi:adenylate cyclase
MTDCGPGASDELLGPQEVCEPEPPTPADRPELIRYAKSLGATGADIDASSNLGELALDLTLRPRGSRTLREVADAAGIDWPTTLRLMTAVGLPTDPEYLVTEDEAATVQLLAGAHNDLLGEEATLQLARVAGNAMARLAETVVGVFRLQVELPRRGAGVSYVDVVKEYSELTKTLLPTFVSTLDAVLRRQIVAVAERMWSTDAEQSIVTVRRTVGFVDLVGYTSAAAALSLRDLTNVLIAFDLRTSEVVAAHNGQIIKMIGDEAMFVTEEVDDACRIALDLIAATDDALPPVRVGLACGEMASVFGDLYGPDVNLASRLVNVAAPSTAVVSGRVRDGCQARFAFEELSPLSLKGFAGLTTAYRIEP